ncbi:MAG: hypothetical protein WAV19_04305, partial [Blautia wexlerae]
IIWLNTTRKISKTLMLSIRQEYGTAALSFFIFSVYSSPVTVHTPLSRKVFWHEYAKIPRHTSQNSIAAGNLE